jgi:formyltetrahydrofolate deformylase
MPLENKRYILTLSCLDTVGIVAAVSGLLRDNHCFIVESGQWGDASTGRFFMRTVFDAQDGAPNYEKLRTKVEGVAFDFTMDFQMYDISNKPKILLMVSRQGHCLNEILHRWASGLLPADIMAVVSNHQDLEQMVKWYNIPFHHLPVTDQTRAEQEAKIYEIMLQQKIDIMVLARYMQILRPAFINKIYGKAINIHHSFLPGFKGARPYHQAFNKGVKIIGATAHFVSNELDEGPIIEQEVTRVDHTQTPDKLLAIGQDVESLVLSRALQYLVERRVLLNGNKTVVFK